MATIGSTVGSHRIAVVEALALNHRTGLTIPQLMKASGVPRMTAHRIMQDFQGKDLVATAPKRGKGEIYRLNGSNYLAVELARAVNSFTVRVAEHEREAALASNDAVEEHCHLTHTWDMALGSNSRTSSFSGRASGAA